MFTTFQNGVGPQGQPSADGNTDSTIVEYTETGTVINQWDLVGKCFPPNYLGTLDPWTGVLFAVPLAGASYEPQGMIFIGR